MPQFDINDYAYACETRMSGGGTEIGVYIDDIVPQGGRIMVGVISHPKDGSKWWWHGPNWTKKAFKTKRGALEEADRVSRTMDVYKAYDAEVRYHETKDDWKWQNVADNH